MSQINDFHNVLFTLYHDTRFVSFIDKSLNVKDVIHYDSPADTELWWP